MDAESAASASRLAGLITLATGVGLTLAPDRVGRLVGIDDARSARLIGIGDLVLAPGLVAGRPRWPWMAARAAANLPMAAVFLSSPHRSARVTGIALLGLTANDVRAARSLHRARR
jgi:hypothetical protein